MKIAVIAKTRLPIAEPFRGGLESFIHTICLEYMRLGHDVTLYAHAKSDPRLNVKSFYDDTYRSGTSFYVYENDEYLSILRDIEQGGYDVVHDNSIHELPIIWGAKAPIPVVTTMHTPPNSRIKASIAMASHSNNLHFITISRAHDKIWQPYLHNGSTIIYNGIDNAKWPLSRTNNDYLFWFGRMVTEKGLDIALDAAHLVGLPLHFAGSLDDQTYYDQKIKPRLQAGDTYLGHLKQSEIAAASSGAAAMINAARWEEPFGLSNIEAMSTGIPVAGFDRGALREIVTSDTGVVATGTTAADLAAAITQAITMDSATVRARAEMFSLTTMAQRYIDYFEEVI